VPQKPSQDAHEPRASIPSRDSIPSERLTSGVVPLRSPRDSRPAIDAPRIDAPRIDGNVVALRAPLPDEVPIRRSPPEGASRSSVRSTSEERRALGQAIGGVAVFALCLALVEGGLLFGAMLRARAHVQGDLTRAALIGLEAAALLPLPLLLCLLPFAWLLSRKIVRELVERVAVGTTDQARGGLGLILYVAVTSWGLGHIVTSGQKAIRASVSGPDRVPLAMMILFVAVGIGAALGTAGIIRPLYAAYGKLVARFPSASHLTSGTGLRLLLLLGCAPTIATLLPLSVGWTLAGGLLGAILFFSRVASSLRARLTRQGGTVFALGVSVVLFAGGLRVVLARDPGVQLFVLQRSPLTASLLVALQRAGDRDGDGYAAWPLGADCDDHDARVHPGAKETAGDGIDQNCSGGDARAFVPLLQAPALQILKAPTPLNLVVVHLDALRPDHLSSEGYPRPTSPVLDRFRQEAVWFENAYTPGPQTRVALQSIFTGLDTPGILLTPARAEEFSLSPQVRTVAQSLASRGYDTTGFTLPWVTTHTTGLERGFNEWRAPWSGEDDRALFSSAEATTDAALAFLHARARAASLALPAAPGAEPAPEEPYELFVHYQCTHLPYFHHEPWDFGTGPVDRYDSALAYCDDQLGRLLADLAAREDWGRTAVIVYSDHGELFGERGFLTHGYSLLEPDVRTVLTLRVPGVAAKTVRAPVSLTDLAPTMIALSGQSPHIRGSSAWNLMPLALHGDGDAAADRAGEERPLFLYADTQPLTTPLHARGVVRGPYRYLRDVSLGTEELYRIDRDPGETINLTSKEPAVRAELAELLDSWESQTPLE
jgi:arylsulfatase A-like enzyme